MAAVSARVMTTFLEELEERLLALDRDLLLLEDQPTPEAQAKLITNLLRDAHSLKGAAASIGAAEIQEVCHRLEDLLIAARDGRTPLSPPYLDTLAKMISAVRERANVLRLPTATAEHPRMREGSIRVHTEKLDRLFEQSSELLVAYHLTRERQREIQTLVEALRQPSPTGIRQIQRALDRLSNNIATDGAVLERAARRVDDEVRNMRMLPFAHAIEGLDRVVRDAAIASGKSARLQVEGQQIELDRSILEGLRTPLVHLVRNAVDHGIEPAEQRSAERKPMEGVVSVSAALRGAGLEIVVEDDGAGLNLRAIGEQARERGLSLEGDISGAVFLPGLSTARTVTGLSGRGVGLDIVQNAVSHFRGTASVFSSEGRGTRFVLSLPLTLTTLRAIIVQLDGQTYAIDTSIVDRVGRYARDAIVYAEGKCMLVTADATMPLVPLRRLLGLPERPASHDAAIQAAIVGSGAQRVALGVDALLDEREIVVRSLGKRHAQTKATAGATILADGSLALILRSSYVLEHGTLLANTLRVAPAQPEASIVRAKRILLVEDSLTTRTLERSILEAAGYDVMTASDGESAWQLLASSDCDLVVSDVDMPRMDGFTLVETIRASSHTRDLPVILVTGRETDDDKKRGVRVGADAYVVKSGFDQRHLLETIADLL